MRGQLTLGTWNVACFGRGVQMKIVMARLLPTAGCSPGNLPADFRCTRALARRTSRAGQCVLILAHGRSSFQGRWHRAMDGRCAEVNAVLTRREVGVGRGHRMTHVGQQRVQHDATLAGRSM